MGYFFYQSFAWKYQQNRGFKTEILSQSEEIATLV